MNFDLLKDKNYLSKLIQDKQLLDKEAKETKGYVYTILEQEKIIPSLDFLLNDLDPLSLKFILNNYELDKNTALKLRKYFSEHESTDNKVIKENLNPQEIEEYLKEGKALPKNTKLTLIQIRKFYKEIEKQFELDEYLTEYILKKSLKDYSAEEFLKLGDSFLRKHLFIMKDFPENFLYKPYKEKFKQLTLEYSKKENFKLGIHQFENYVFEQEDKEFLDFLMKNNTTLFFECYNSLLKIKGFAELISGWDYVKNYNCFNIEHLSLEETKEHQEEIRELLLNHKEVKKNPYSGLREIFRTKCSQQQFEIIFDESFLEKIIHSELELSLRNLDVDHSDEKKKEFIIGNLMLDYIAKHSQDNYTISKFDIEDIIKMEDNFTKSWYEPHEQELKDKEVNRTKKIYSEVIPKFFLTKELDSIVRNRKYIIRDRNYNNILELIEQQPSENLLYVLLEHTNEIRSRFNNFEKKRISQTISELACRCDANTVKKLNSHFNTNYESKITTNNGFEKNFTNWIGQDINSIPNNIKFILINIDEKFRQEVLNKKIFIDNDIINSILYEDNPKLYDFFDTYVKNNMEDILKDSRLSKNIISNQRTFNLLPISSKESQEEKLELLFSTINIIDNLENREIKEETRNKKDKAAQKKINNDLKELKQKVEDLKTDFSFDFIKEKVENLLYNKKFKQLDIVFDLHINSDLKEFFYVYVNNLEFDQLLKNLEDPYFTKLVVNSMGYDHNTKIKFNKFSTQENTILAELLFEQFKQTSQPSNVLYFFSPECLSFANEFAVKNLSREMFFSYSLTPPKNRSKDLIQKHYTNKQIIRAFKNLDSSEGFFNYKDVNARLSHFFTYNFSGREKQFLEFADECKKYPKIYALLVNQELLSSFRDDWGFKGNDDNSRKTKDQSAMCYFKDKFDIDIILEGLKQIFKEIKDNSDNSKFNTKLALQAVNHFVWCTYYDKRNDQTGYDEYFSNFTEEESKKILKILFKEAPGFVMSLNVLGSIKDVSQYIKNNFEEFYHQDIIEDLFFNSHLTYTDNFSIQNRYEDYVNKILNGFIDHLIKKQDNQSIQFLDHLAKQLKFINNELSYDCRYSTHVDSDILKFFSENETLQEKMKVMLSKNLFEDSFGSKNRTLLKKSLRF